MKPQKNIWQLPLAAAVVYALGTGSAHAGGFALIEMGASGMGNAYAGAGAVSADTSTVWFNPAGMLALAGRELSVAGHVIGSDTNYEDQGSTLSSVVGGAPVSGQTSDQPGGATVIPNIFYVHPVSEDLAFGFGVTIPFGSSTNYDDDWTGRYLTIESAVQVLDLNPTVAFRVNDKFILGGGISLQYMSATLGSAVDSGTSCLGLAAQGAFPATDCLNAGLVPGNLLTDSSAEINGDNVEFTFNLSAQYEPRVGTRLGVAYRHSADHLLEGDADFTLHPALASVIEANNTPLFMDGGANAGANLPAMLSFSVAHQATGNLQLLADATWTGWSSIEEIRVVFDNPAQPDSPTPLEWEDVWRLSAGFNYLLNEKWTLRGGFAFDQEAIPSANLRSPRIPGNDRTWFSVGAGYNISQNSSFDIGFAHLAIDETPIDYNVLDAAGSQTVRGLYDTSVNILSAQFNWKFK